MTSSLIGQTLAGRYQFEELLGEGSFANVYRTTDLQRRVCLAAKVLRSDIAHNPTFSERFRREAAVLERLQHPNIVRYYGLVEIDKPAHYTFILMDYVPGDTLDTFLERHPGPFKPYASFTYLTPLAAALHYAHSEGIIHRDLKPANILLHENGTLYVTDFGLARILNQTSTLTVGMSVGTPYFMSPEQITGAPITPATDIYSLGIILYRMYTGQLPFQGQSPDAVGSSLTERIAHEHIHITPPRPSRVYAEINPAVEDVLLHALAKDPLRRYPSISALYDALAEAVGAPPITLAEPSIEAGTATTEPPDIKPPEWSQFMPSIPEPPRGDSDTDEIKVDSPVSEQPVLEADASQVTLYRSRVTKDPTRETIEHPAPPATDPHLEKRLDSHTSRTAPAILIARERPAYQAPAMDSAGYVPPAPPRRRNWLPIAAVVGALLIAAAVCGAIVYLLTNAIDDDKTSPDAESPQEATSDQSAAPAPPAAQRFAFDSRRSGSLDLYIMNIDGSGLRQITNTSGAERGPAWSPDGTQIAFYGAEVEQGSYDIYLVNSDGTDLRNLTQSPNVDERYPTWSPDGTRLAFHSNQDGDYDLYIINRDGTDARNITNNAANDLGPDWSPDGSQIAFHTDMWGESYEIALIDLNTGAVNRLTADSGTHSFPTWSPDGTRLAFHTLADDTVNIFLMKPDGSFVQQLTYGTSRSAFPDWSPDGATIIYQTGPELESSIAIIAVEGGTPEPLTGNQANFLPEWAP